MSRLDKIEADLHRHARRSDPPVFQDYGELLIRAVRQLGVDRIAWINTMRMIAGGNNRAEALAMAALHDIDGVFDPDVLDLIANLEQGANEQD